MDASKVPNTPKLKSATNVYDKGGGPTVLEEQVYEDRIALWYRQGTLLWVVGMGAKADPVIFKNDCRAKLTAPNSAHFAWRACKRPSRHHMGWAAVGFDDYTQNMMAQRDLKSWCWRNHPIFTRVSVGIFASMTSTTNSVFTAARTLPIRPYTTESRRIKCGQFSEANGRFQTSRTRRHNEDHSTARRHRARRCQPRAPANARCPRPLCRCRLYRRSPLHLGRSVAESDAGRA